MGETPHRIVTRSTVCLLDGKQYATLAYALPEIRKACAAGGPDLVVTPFMPFLSFREGHEAADLAPFAKLAREYRTYLAVALVEEWHYDRRSHTALLFGRDGSLTGKYRQTHLLPDEDGIVRGDDLPVFATDFGTLGLSLASDFYFPEVHWVQAMKGAEILVWQSAPERFRQHGEWLPILQARCLDCHAHMVTAMAADPRTYLANRYEMGMPGAAWGRSMVLNRVGVPIADTGYGDGVATAVVDLDKRKVDVHAPWYQGENVFFTNCLGDRQAFRPLAEPYVAPKRPTYRKRAARIAIGYLGSRSIWRNDAVPEGMLRVIDEAADARPDLLLLTEMSGKIENETVRRVAAMVGERARRMQSYIVIGGIGNEEYLSIARVWDREGREVFQEPIYWTKGFPALEVFDADFARIGIHTCGDLYTPEIDRVLALKGAELILDPSQYWGGGGENDQMILRARAADNGCWLACAHWNTSDSAHRSVIVDSYGCVVAASQFQREGVVCTDIDFDDVKVYYAGRKPEQPVPGETGIPSYFTGDLPEQRPGWREMMFSRRRPELYGSLPTVNEVTRKYRPSREPWS